MKQKLQHILDNSVCITQRQLKEYIAGTMTDEECHALEHHLNNCLICSDAVDGAMMHEKEETLAITANFNSEFIKAHFSLQDPQVHLNSIAPTLKKKGSKKPFWFKTSATVLIIAGAVAILLLQGGKPWPYKLKHLRGLKDKSVSTEQINTSSTIASK